MSEVKIGKSYKRRYYEDLIERFEAEAKYINSKEEFEKKQLEIITSIRESHLQNLIGIEHLRQYLERIKKIEYDKKTMSKDELRDFVKNSKSKKGEDGINDKQERTKEMAKEKEFLVKEDVDRY